MIKDIKDCKMNPFLKYPGGKTKEIDIILNNTPNNIQRYIEPFVGGGSVYFAINNNQSYINDKSQDLYDLYTMIKFQNKYLKNYLLSFDKIWHTLNIQQVYDINFNINELNKEKFIKYYIDIKTKKEKRFEKLLLNNINIKQNNIKDIDVTAKKASFYNLIRDIYNNKARTNIEFHIASFYFIREYCYSSMFRFSTKGKFNVPYGGISYNEKYIKNKIDYMFSNLMKDCLKNTIICNDDFEIFLNKISPQKNDFIFLDPPYDSMFSTYDNNVFDKNEHIRLKNYLTNTQAQWMLIIKKTDFILDLYSNFNIYEYNMCYNVNFKNRNDKQIKHLLITNYILKNFN